MRVLRALVVPGIAALALGIGTASASAATTTLHFFGVGVRFDVMTPSGRTLGENDFPMKGDKLIAEAGLFAGNRVSHSADLDGVAHLFCTFVNNDGWARCAALLTVTGEGQLIGADVMVDFAVENGTLIPLNNGNGAFAGTKTGSVLVESIGDTNNDDFVVTYTT